MSLIRPSGASAMFAIAAAVLLAVPSTASASADLGPDDHCSYGNAMSIVQAFFPILWRTNFDDFDEDGAIVWRSPDDIVARCQFRGFAEPAEGICFCEHDTFVAGTVFFDAPELIADIRRSDVEMSVPEVTDMSFETYATPIKRGHHAFWGFSVWKQWSTILEDLAPGTYTLHSAYYWDGEDDGEDDITFTVLPHATAHTHGRPIDGLAGSVTCPPVDAE